MRKKILIYLIFSAFIVLSCQKSYSYQNLSNYKFDVITLPSSSSGTVSSTNTLDFDVSSNPLFPSIVELPPIGDVFSKRPGYGLIGSNPTYEIKLNNKSNNIEIKTIDLIDSNNQSFRAIPFNVLKVNNTEDRLLITITIPDTIAIGSSEFILNLADGTSLIGELELVNFLRVQTKKTKQVLGKPTISRTSLKRNKSVFTLSIKGKNFSPNNITYTNSTGQNESSDPENTSVIILPSTLNAEVLDTTVEDTNSLKIKFDFVDDLTEAADIVIIITTPRGITSKGLTISDKFIFF